MLLTSHHISLKSCGFDMLRSVFVMLHIFLLFQKIFLDPKSRTHTFLFFHLTKLKVAVNVSGGEQTFPQIMADFSLFVH